MMKAPDKKTFNKEFDDLQLVVDVDDSAGRSAPINMNFTETGFLTKDTGSEMFGATETELCHSDFNYVKKSGTEYRIRAKGTYLQSYDTGTGLWTNLGSGTVTMTIASPAVVSQTAHGLKSGTKISFTTTGALPTGVVAGTTYYVIATGLTADAFQFSATLGGSAVDTSGSQSGVHTLFRRYTTDKEFGYIVYNDTLYFGNAYENFTSWTGTAFAEYDTLPKGNVYEIFEDRLFIAGVVAEPLTLYYSNVGVPTTFTGSDIIKPLGTDSIKTIVNYYGTLMVFKQDTIWKITFQYDQVVSLFVPKMEVQSGTYGACSRKAVTWVENELWFFTGREVRAIGYQENNTGVFGVNKSTISEQIKETLKLITPANYDLIATAYNDRKFYLAVPLGSTAVNDTVFVCHLLYNKLWTKYTERVKANTFSFLVVDNVVYTSLSTSSYGTLKWNDALTADISLEISSSVVFKKYENNNFNVSNLYRYVDLLFKDLTGTVTATINQDLHNSRNQKTNSFYVGSTVEGEENALGEVDFGEYLIADSFGEEVSETPFLRKKLSMLIKAQSITLGLSNSSATETFTIAAYGFSGYEEPTLYFDKSQITNLN